MDRRSTIAEFISIFQTFRVILHIFLFTISPVKAVIEKDIERWFKETESEIDLKYPKWRGLVWFLWRFPEFRNLFYYRIEKEHRVVSRVLSEFAKLFCKPMNTLYIVTPVIGEGFFIQHGFSTIIAAKSIGKNCWINQQVTIGFSSDADAPIIEDNVHITAGAKVFGDITIGSNSIIGANAVVVKNVPPNCTVVGVPGYIIKLDGVKIKKQL
jgi:serine O-acetyltransferase